MLKKIRYIFLILIILTGCSFYLHSTIKVSEILTDDNKIIIANLKVFLPGSCGDKTIDEIVSKFQKNGLPVTFNKCTREYAYGDNYANFSVPIEIVKDHGEPKETSNLFYFSYADKIFSIKTGPNYKIVQGDEKISFNEISFSLINDTQDKITIMPFMLFVNNVPKKYEHILLSPYKQVDLSLSNVVRKALEQPNETFPIFSLWKQKSKTKDNAIIDNNEKCLLEYGQASQTQLFLNEAIIPYCKVKHTLTAEVEKCMEDLLSYIREMNNKKSCSKNVAAASNYSNILFNKNDDDDPLILLAKIYDEIGIHFQCSVSKTLCEPTNRKHDALNSGKDIN